MQQRGLNTDVQDGHNVACNCTCNSPGFMSCVYIPLRNRGIKRGKLILDGKWWQVGRLLAVSLINMVERLEKFQVLDFSCLVVFFSPLLVVIKPKGEMEEGTG